MKVVKSANGKTKIKISRKEWEAIGKKAAWNDPERHSLPEEDMVKLEAYIAKLYPGEDNSMERFNALNAVMNENPSTLEEAMIAVKERFNFASRKNSLKRAAQTDQLQPLDGVQNSEGAKGGSAKSKKSKCSAEGCDKEFRYDPSNPKETKCEHCRKK
ncbi:MAG: hypothetical protein WC119_02480 [Synergistaceae bacterium]